MFRHGVLKKRNKKSDGKTVQMYHECLSGLPTDLPDESAWDFYHISELQANNKLTQASTFRKFGQFHPGPKFEARAQSQQELMLQLLESYAGYSAKRSDEDWEEMVETFMNLIIKTHHITNERKTCVVDRIGALEDGPGCEMGELIVLWPLDTELGTQIVAFEFLGGRNNTSDHDILSGVSRYYEGLLCRGSARNVIDYSGTKIQRSPCPIAFSCKEVKELIVEGRSVAMALNPNCGRISGALELKKGETFSRNRYATLLNVSPLFIYGFFPNPPEYNEAILQNPESHNKFIRTSGIEPEYRKRLGIVGPDPVTGEIMARPVPVGNVTPQFGDTSKIVICGDTVYLWGDPLPDPRLLALMTEGLNSSEATELFEQSSKRTDLVRSFLRGADSEKPNGGELNVELSSLLPDTESELISLTDPAKMVTLRPRLYSLRTSDDQNPEWELVPVQSGKAPTEAVVGSKLGADVTICYFETDSYSPMTCGEALVHCDGRIFAFGARPMEEFTLCLYWVAIFELHSAEWSWQTIDVSTELETIVVPGDRFVMVLSPNCVSVFDMITLKQESYRAAVPRNISCYSGRIIHPVGSEDVASNKMQVVLLSGGILERWDFLFERPVDLLHVTRKKEIKGMSLEMGEGTRRPPPIIMSSENLVAQFDGLTQLWPYMQNVSQH